MKNIHITTSIAYANSVPHIGYAMELIEADSIARWHRMRGDDVFFLTGTDEHGTKIYQTAEEQGISPQALCDKNSAEFQRLTKVLNISNDDFIRTTEERHKKRVQEIWKLITKDLEKREFQGLYCAGCEAFVTEKELVDGHCPNHLKAPEKLSEENWFFKLSKYSEEILRLMDSGEMKVIPENRAREIHSFVKSGLRDISFSRPRKTLPWGVDVPNDPDQVMYVWCDALSNYITALGFGSDDDSNFQKYWENGEVVHVIGKDILRFHSAYWPAMLKSAGIKTPDKILVHGFLTSEGQKMSKSLGNVVDPFEIAEQDGVDSLRFFLLHEVPLGRDADFSRERFLEMKNAHLANSLGNLLQRVYTLAKRAEIQKGSSEMSSALRNEAKKAQKKQEKAMENYELHTAIQAPFDFCAFMNQEINTLAPWKMEASEARAVIEDFLEGLRLVAKMIAPFLPETAEKMRSVLGLTEDFEWSGKLGESIILFPRD